MSSLEQLTKKIQELVPEIMELQFGCKFKYENELYIFASYTGMMTDIHQGAHSIFIAKKAGCADLEDYIRINAEYEIKILGRDIQLADVLLAYKRHIGIDGLITISAEGDILSNGDVAWWDFLKPLHQQSPETIDFLHSILCL